MEDKYYTESHKKAIDRYDKDFNNTEKNVHNKADSNSKKAYAFAIPAVVIALLLIAFIGIALTGSVKKAVKKSAITNNYTEISNKIYSYLDSSSYKELSDYSDEIDALDNKAFDKEYSVLMGVRYYVWSVGFMNTNDSDNYNLTQSDVSNLAYYLSQFYYYTQLSAYKDKEGRIYTIVPKCAHLGCELSWNNLDKTWDCPCHGSRYDYTGKMLYGPTVKDLYINK